MKELKELRFFINSHIDQFSERKLEIIETGLKITEKEYAKTFNWKDILYISNTDKFVHFIFSNTNHLLIPKNCFISKNDIKYFLELVTHETFKYRKELKKPFPVEKPTYSLGILGIIPLVGGLLGIVLILLGLFIYKDRILTIIGSASIIFTIYLYWDLII
ncbi:MAG: YcxB family protein [Bacteroidetes bacterium]|nr:YcxB family protein [Bacteroidota bacterium]